MASNDNINFFDQQKANSRIKARIVSEYFPHYCQIIASKHMPKVSMKDMAEVIGTTQRQCERIVAKMKADGLIRRVGATKNDHWERL